MNTQELCSLCGEGHVTIHSEMVENEYKGQKAMLPLVFKQCGTCGSDFAGASEAKLNKRALMAYRKQVDGMLTGEEITALRKQYKMTQGQAARLFGGGPVAFSKYENDDVVQSEAMDTLLRLVRRSKEAFWALVEEKEMRAEFMEPKPVVQTAVRFTSLTLVRRVEARVDPRYNPREFRRYEPEDAACNL
ncbi:MAG: type II toxin-antitoxin system MqsA family antitoxin [Rhodoferax sp.]|nr:type II toxin-antitoxin system MqsA family antitoxin [Rhodoferax sp.]